MTIGAALQGAVGFGMGLFSVPLLIHFAPQLIPGPMLAVAMVLNVFIARRDWREADLREVAWALAGRIPGSVAGAMILATISTAWVGPLFGILILVAVIVTALGFQFRPTPKTLVGAGVLSGLMATIVSIGGPPIAIIFQHESGARIRGTLSAFFFVGIVVSLISLASVGLFGKDELISTAMLLPPVLVGFLFSTRLAQRLDRGHTRRAVLAVATLSGLMVIVRWVVGF